MRGRRRRQSLAAAFVILFLPALLGLRPAVTASVLPPTRAGSGEPGSDAVTATGGVLANFTAQGSNLIRLQAGAFDPLHDPPPAAAGIPLVSEDLLAPDGAQYWLVQVRDGRYADAAQAVSAAGGTVAGVVPDATYVVRATPRQRLALALEPAVRWTGYYQPAWRVPTAANGLPGLTDLTGLQEYRVFAFRSDPGAAELGAALAAVAGAQVMDDAGPVVDVRATAAQLPAIAAVPAVEWVSAKPRFVSLNDDARWVIDTAVRDLRAATAAGRLDGAGQTAAVADTSLNYLRDDLGTAHVAFRDCPGNDLTGCLQADYTQVTAGHATDELLDVQASGTHHRKMAAFFDLGATGPNPSDESAHGTHVAGSVVGDAGAPGAADGHDGMAPAARHVHQNVADPDGGLGGIPTDYYQLFRQAYRPRDPASVPETSPEVGNVDDYGRYVADEDARTHNNSYGVSIPVVDLFAQASAIDRFTWDHEDMAVVASAGNGGPELGSLGSPAVSKNGFSSGASSNGRQPMVSIGSMANFSSHGPTGDGRFGVTVATPGEVVVSAKGGTDDGYHYLQGTSMSGPVLTGALTLVRQYFADGFGPAGGKGFAAGAPDAARSWNPSAALVKAAVVNGAERMRGWYTGDEGTARAMDGQWPSAGQGFGRVNLDNSLYFAGDPVNSWYHDVWRADAEAFTVADTGQVRSYTVTVAPGQPLDVTLAWTDAPNALATGTPALVNDLDLVVSGPGGTYLGNALNSRTDPSVDAAETTPGSPVGDHVNTVERVRIAAPEPGTYTVSVAATRVLVGRQGFALAASGLIWAPDQPFAPGPPRQADAPGAPAITAPSATPVSADLATVRFATSEPTTGRVLVSGPSGAPAYADTYNLGGAVSQPATYPGFDTAAVETGPDYANRPVVGTDHEFFLTGLRRATTYTALLEATDLAGQVTTTTLSFTTPANVFQPQAGDIGQLTEDESGDRWKNGKQLYAGTAAGVGFLGAFMLRLPADVDPAAITGAIVELTAAHDLSSHYRHDPLLSVELLDESVEDAWGTQTYAVIHEAPALAAVLPRTTVRTGAGQRLAFAVSCRELGALRQTLSTVTDGERRAAFRWEASDTDLTSLVSTEFGFNRRSQGPTLRPKLILLTAEDAAVPPLDACDSATPAPTISDVRFDTDYTAGSGDTVAIPDAVTVSWRTDVPSDSVVLFRERGSRRWTQVRNPARTTLHQVQVRGVDPTRHYEFGVRSTACNGASTTADNRGRGWDFFRASGPVTGEQTFTFDTGPEGWTTAFVDDHPVPPDTRWELRGPQAGTEAAWHAEPYGDQQEAYLISPPLSIAGSAAAVSLRERHDLEQPVPGVTTTGDALRVDYSTDGGSTWRVADSYQQRNAAYPGFDNETTPVFGVPGGTVQLRITLTSDFSLSTPPWQGAAVDDVTVLSYAPPAGAEDPLFWAPGPVVPLSAGAKNLKMARVATRRTADDADVAAGTSVCLPPAS